MDHLMKPFERERQREASLYECIKQRAMEALRGTVTPDLPARSLKMRIAVATVDASFHDDVRKTEIAKIQRDIFRAMVEGRADATGD